MFMMIEREKGEKQKEGKKEGKKAVNCEVGRISKNKKRTKEKRKVQEER